LLSSWENIKHKDARIFGGDIKELELFLESGKKLIFAQLINK